MVFAYYKNAYTPVKEKVRVLSLKFRELEHRECSLKNSLERLEFDTNDLIFSCGLLGFLGGLVTVVLVTGTSYALYKKAYIDSLQIPIKRICGDNYLPVHGREQYLSLAKKQGLIGENFTGSFMLRSDLHNLLKVNLEDTLQEKKVCLINILNFRAQGQISTATTVDELYVLQAKYELPLFFVDRLALLLT